MKPSPKFQTSIVGLICFFFIPLVCGQNVLNIAFRPGANFPAQDLGQYKLNQGSGFEATVAYRFRPHFEVYAGWGWNRFQERKSITSSNLQFEETGYSFGLRFIHPLTPGSKINFVLGGGGIYNHIETENSEGDIIDDTAHGLGCQFDAGIAIPVGHHNRWQIMPNMRFRSLSRHMSPVGTDTRVNLRYLSPGVSVVWIIVKS